MAAQAGDQSVAAGHQVGSHGFLHERAYDLGEAGFREDLRRSVAALAAAAGRPTCFRAPSSAERAGLPTSASASGRAAKRRRRNIP